MDTNSTLGVARLQELVVLLKHANVTSERQWREWAKENVPTLEKIFQYASSNGMPKINYLVKAFFHPNYPLIGFNYTPVAHNTLHQHPEGWTEPLRLCRGIIFDRDGTLLALPFRKFFNYGETPESTDLPDEPFVATVKQDGHLGIIFWYDDRLLLTTRGDFTSPTSKIGNEMLQRLALERNWARYYGKHLTLLVEIIHPDTHVLTDYGDRQDFVIIGGSNRFRQLDYQYHQLGRIAKELGLPLTEKWDGKSVGDLMALMKDRAIENQEGFVVRFTSGRRVKFKFETYIGKMVQEKLSYTYLLNRMVSGNLQKMLATLPEEIYDIALKMLGEIMLRISIQGTPQQKWRNLYLIDSKKKDNASFQTACRNFVRSFGSE